MINVRGRAGRRQGSWQGRPAAMLGALVVTGDMKTQVRRAFSDLPLDRQVPRHRTALRCPVSGSDTVCILHQCRHRQSATRRIENEGSATSRWAECAMTSSSDQSDQSDSRCFHPNSAACHKAREPPFPFPLAPSRQLAHDLFLSVVSARLSHHRR